MKTVEVNNQKFRQVIKANDLVGFPSTSFDKGWEFCDMTGTVVAISIGENSKEVYFVSTSLVDCSEQKMKKVA